MDQTGKVATDIKSYGWHVTLVKKEGDSPGWAFSVGFYHTFKRPEVLLFGLPSDTMHAVINTVGENFRSGEIYESGHEYTGLFADAVPCIFQLVEKIWYEPLLGYARRFYQSDDFPVLQCFWPDKQRNYPWSPNFDPQLYALQPLLFHQDIKKARAKKLLESFGRELSSKHGPLLEESKRQREKDKPSHHTFGPGEWPFPDPESVETFTTVRVVDENYPILYVTHDEDGAWQILCGTTNDPQDIRSVCLGCMYEKDRSIRELADLPKGWEAWRESKNSAWNRRRML
jgi:uncharacterized protein DUF4262